MCFHPLSRATAETRSIAAFATTARLPPSPSKWGIVPSHMSIIAVRRTRPLGQRHLSHGTGRRTAPPVLGMAGEHVVVEHQRVPDAKQLGKAHRRRRTVRADAAE